MRQMSNDFLTELCSYSAAIAEDVKELNREISVDKVNDMGIEAIALVGKMAAFTLGKEYASPSEVNRYLRETGGIDIPLEYLCRVFNEIENFSLLSNITDSDKYRLVLSLVSPVTEYLMLIVKFTIEADVSCSLIDYLDSIEFKQMVEEWDRHYLRIDCNSNV